MNHIQTVYKEVDPYIIASEVPDDYNIDEFFGQIFKDNVKRVVNLFQPHGYYYGKEESKISNDWDLDAAQYYPLREGYFLESSSYKIQTLRVLQSENEGKNCTYLCRLVQKETNKSHDFTIYHFKSFEEFGAPAKNAMPYFENMINDIVGQIESSEIIDDNNKYSKKILVHCRAG